MCTLCRFIPPYLDAVTNGVFGCLKRVYCRSMTIVGCLQTGISGVIVVLLPLVVLVLVLVLGSRLACEQVVGRFTVYLAL